jgi:dephospho-CoA kinase
MQNTDPAKQNIAKCMEMAHYVLDNNWTFEDLYRQVDVIVKK